LKEKITMKNSRNPTDGKIINHDQAVGLPGRSDVEERADEDAQIEGHRGVSNEDRRQAELELEGNDVAAVTNDDAEGTSSLSRDPSEPPSIPGRQIPDRETDDEQMASERLVMEGVNEAEHDQMTAARRRRQD